MVKTGAEIRHDAKERMKKYRDEMTAKGYISTTVFLSESHRAELKRLGDEHRLTRAEAAEHIFQIYLQSENKDATQTHNTNIESLSKTRATIEALEARLKALEEKDSKPAEIIEDQETPSLAIDPVLEEELPEYPPGDMPGPSDREAYKKWLVNEIDRLKDSGMGWVEIMNTFNSETIVTVTGKPWGRGAVEVFYKRAQKF